MTQRVYGLVRDYGDGSSGMRWYRDEKKVNALLDVDSPEWDETFAVNEGSPNMVLTFPAGLDLEGCGFRFDDGENF